MHAHICAQKRHKIMPTNTISHQIHAHNTFLFHAISVKFALVMCLSKCFSLTHSPAHSLTTTTAVGVNYILVRGKNAFCILGVHGKDKVQTETTFCTTVKNLSAISAISLVRFARSPTHQ